MLMNAIYYCAFYHEAAKRVDEDFSESANNECLVVHATAGALAGALAALSNYTMWSKLNCSARFKDIGSINCVLLVPKYPYTCAQKLAPAIQGVCGSDRFKSGSIRDVFQVIVKKDGYRGLMREWIPELHRRFVSALHQLGGSQG
ncbi:hypothetical protein FNV43_RR15459 [Rhamnella rubrinervis]|uniref:Uncharacterized protein n=1 Tax=Rhamnella rubrinervis TaxID=2594499 RepID=A0A8K0E1U7_9ROSA|nr:hypothetical protein FNV43_RR15459 [Rhamnella rubrinervis]